MLQYVRLLRISTFAFSATVLQCAAGCCSVCVLRRGAVCPTFENVYLRLIGIVLEVCCSILQYVEIICNVVQHIAQCQAFGNVYLRLIIIFFGCLLNFFDLSL